MHVGKKVSRRGPGGNDGPDLEPTTTILTIHSEAEIQQKARQFDNIEDVFASLREMEKSIEERAAEMEHKSLAASSSSTGKGPGGAGGGGRRGSTLTNSHHAHSKERESKRIELPGVVERNPVITDTELLAIRGVWKKPKFPPPSSNFNNRNYSTENKETHEKEAAEDFTFDLTTDDIDMLENMNRGRRRKVATESDLVAAFNVLERQQNERRKRKVAAVGRKDGQPGGGAP
eukprot:Cvel_32275.t1-p1 / transcript=Cvel_32275.t1 / gene=Cvel_32275 / organism=Chromera_velia_CCMP2878 / gene_product=hypothetical protein / transcript_product=hypothetical protein / location=Cvel_scaffold4982:1-1532(-) / protein_length=231 / sequence_SO=supercontig / SO=protein_coding / is_pseudo=false